jgi:hypothetical protein
MLALEGTAESLLRLVADPSSDCGDAEIRRAQEVLGDVHAPSGEVPDRGDPQHVPEPLVEQPDRNMGLPCIARLTAWWPT